MRMVQWRFFFFNDTATTEIYTLSLHDALPIWIHAVRGDVAEQQGMAVRSGPGDVLAGDRAVCAGAVVDHDGPAEDRAQPLRSEEHTSELQSRQYLVCRLLLEKKKNIPPTCLLT